MGEILGEVESTCEHCLSAHAKYIVKHNDFVYCYCRNCTWEIKEEKE